MVEVKRIWCVRTVANGKLDLGLSVGDVARRSGVAVSTLHFYESKGLIRSARTRGNQRRYPRSILRRIAIIRLAQKAGIPLAAIQKALASLPRERTPTVADWRELSTRWRADLDSRIQRLIQLRDRLNDCIGCGCLSVTACPLRNSEDALGRKGSGPRLLEQG